jgi:hypothetical protein
VLALLCAIAVPACFPYSETYRQEVKGRVVDEAGAPVAGVRVDACSASRWSGGATVEGAACPRRSTAVTSATGDFSFAPVRERSWCCLGEAPLPFTRLYACAADGRAGLAVFNAKPGPLSLTLPVGAAPPVQAPLGPSYGDGSDEQGSTRAWCGALRVAPGP